MAAGDAPPGLPGWRIEVAALDVPGAPPPQIVHLANRGIATSGDVFQRVEIEGKRYSHIVDPHTGLGLTDHSLVTVIAPDCFTANCYTTSVSVLGPDSTVKLRQFELTLDTISKFLNAHPEVLTAALANSQKFVPNVQVGGSGDSGVSGLMMAILGQQLAGTPAAQALSPKPPVATPTSPATSTGQARR